MCVTFEDLNYDDDIECHESSIENHDFSSRVNSVTLILFTHNIDLNAKISRGFLAVIFFSFIQKIIQTHVWYQLMYMDLKKNKTFK